MQHVNKKLKQLRGKLAEVTFLDHGVGAQEPIQCRVYGRIRLVTPTYISLTYWELPADDKDVREANEEHLVIVNSCITQLRALR